MKKIYKKRGVYRKIYLFKCI